MEECEVIFAADVVRVFLPCTKIFFLSPSMQIYDPDLVSALVPALAALLESDGEIQKIAYIAATLRNTETYKFFLDLLPKFGLSWTVEEDLHKSLPCLFQYPNRTNIKMIKVKK